MVQDNTHLRAGAMTLTQAIKESLDAGLLALEAPPVKLCLSLSALFNPLKHVGYHPFALR